MFKDKFFPNIVSTARHGFRRKSTAEAEKQDPKLNETLRRLCSEASNPRLYIDTCAFLHKSGYALLDAVERILPECHLELYVPASVLYELENVGSKDTKNREQSREMIEKITALEQNGLVRIVLTNSPTFTDAGLLSRFVSECQYYDIILLTQDRELAKRAQQLPSFLDGCVNATHTIKVYKLTAHGSLVKNDDCHLIERKVFNHGNTEIHCNEQLPYPCFYSHV